jgi:hypothetical protein
MTRKVRFERGTWLFRLFGLPFLLAPLPVLLSGQLEALPLVSLHFCAGLGLAFWRRTVVVDPAKKVVWRGWGVFVPWSGKQVAFDAVTHVVLKYELRLPAAGLGLSGGIVTLIAPVMGALVFVPVIGVSMSSHRASPGPMFGFFVLLGVVTVGLIAGLGLRPLRRALQKTVVRVTPDGVTIETRFLSERRTTIGAAELETVSVGTDAGALIGAANKSAMILGSDRGSLAVGTGLERSELEWLCAMVKQGLVGRRSGGATEPAASYDALSGIPDGMFE